MAVEWMTLLSAGAVIILILFIILILLRANHDLARAQKEGEHFVDEWAEREEKLEEKRRRRIEQEEQQIKMEQARKDRAEFEASFRGVANRQAHGPADSAHEDHHVDHHVRTDCSDLALIELDSSKRILRQIPVDHVPFLIGRSSSNDLVLEDLYVSRHHVVIERSQGHYVAVDQGTKNKIFANGRLYDRLSLEAGQHFYIGNIEFLVEMRG